MESLRAEVGHSSPALPKSEDDRDSSVLSVPPRLWSRQVLGPSAVFAALAIGSGELVFWPGLSLSNGAGVLLIALAAVLCQYILDVEIGRYSLATGESAVVGATRMWRGWAWVLLLGTLVPWLWPGWARAGCQLIEAASGLPEKPLSIASLLLCGLLLAAPSRVYNLLERLQTVLLIFIIAGVCLIVAAAVAKSPNTLPFWRSLATGEGLRGLYLKATQSQTQDYLALLSGIVFAGAGGILNLGYGLLLCEKRFGMGKYSSPILGLKHSLGLQAAETDKPQLYPNSTTLKRWRQWLRLSAQEHALLFVGGNTLTIVLISLTFYSLLGGKSTGQGMGFVIAAADQLSHIGGAVMSLLFTSVAFVIFFTSEIGILDITARLATGILYSMFEFRKLQPSAIYHAVVWLEILTGIALIIGDSRQPYWFLITSAVLNVLVMAIYSALVVILNRTRLPEFARPRLGTSLFLAVAGVAYATLFVLTLFHL